MGSLRHIGRRAVFVTVAVTAAVTTVAACGSSSQTAKVPAGAAGITHLTKVAAGNCLTWDQAAGPQRTGAVVPCSAPHLAEVTGSATIAGLGSAFPGQTAIAAFASKACVDPTTSYLGHPVDPLGRFGPAAIYPTQASWDTGQRSLICDLVVRQPPGTATLAVATGPVAATNETAPLFGVGTCLAQVASSSATVACDRTHLVEVTGTATAPAGAKLPTDATEYSALIGQACAVDAQNYLAGRLYLGVASGWLPVPAVSWAAGRRLVTCLIGHQADDGTWEAEPGTLRSTGTKGEG